MAHLSGGTASTRTSLSGLAGRGTLGSPRFSGAPQRGTPCRYNSHKHSEILGLALFRWGSSRPVIRSRGTLTPTDGRAR